MKNISIAIDGPAGAGKSTISRAVAERLKFVYIDTGAMYRAVGLAALKHGYDTKNPELIVPMMNETKVDIKHSEDGQLVFLNGEDVTKKIRTPEVSVAASDVSAIPEVRVRLVELQRALAQSRSVIMDGRDIGTYVLPNAQIKIFLTASPEERARRRFEELSAKGVKTDFESVKADMEYRDKNDSSREFAPLKPAEDSEIVDTTGNTQEQSVEQIYNLIVQKINAI